MVSVWAYIASKCDFQKMSKNCSFWDFSEFSENLHFSLFESLEHGEGPPRNTHQGGNTLGSCCLKTPLVVFVAENCWFYWIFNIILHFFMSIFFRYWQNQQFSATKTTSGVFKQHDPQSFADLSGVAGALLWELYGT